MAPGVGDVAKCNTGATEPFFLSQSFPYFLRRAFASLGFTIVRIGAERHGRVGVTGGGLNLLEVQTGLKERRDVGVPLRYNYDKPEKPRISRAFGYLARFFILFQTEKSSREVVIS